MRLRSLTNRMVPVLIAGAVLLTGCSPDPSSSVHGTGSQREAAHSQRDPLHALRSGLADASGAAAFYLSLGDSLSQGVQPTATGQDVATSRGYPDRLVARLRGHLQHLHLIKLGCSGETTQTMIHGGICHYPAGSQLAQAARFLRAHRGRTALVTIDIGANDPNSCVIDKGLTSILPCLVSSMPRIGKNLDQILATLRTAAGKRVLIVGMTYYVPELGLWKRGTPGRQIGILTGAVAAGANKMLTDSYQRYGARVANVFAAFRTSDFGEKNGRPNSKAPSKASKPGSMPPNVATICSLTWMCASAPRGPDEHANNAGYRVIARTFWRAIASSP
jgi:lysophospholipase L1-like esterase